ncbi:hypothetical protein KKA66_02580 [Patescibacteria group bacterium]|nr:hypothetical protein [Patescibacteria group bacterium]
MEQANKKQSRVLGTESRLSIIFNQYFTIFLIVTILLIVVLSYFLFAPHLINQYTKMSANVMEEKKIELNKQKDKLKELTELSNVYSSIGEPLKEKVLQLLPQQAGLANLYYNLDQITKEAKYEIEEIEVSLPKDEQITKNLAKIVVESDNLEQDLPVASLKEIKIDIKLSGSGYLNLKNLVELLEKNLRIFDIESFEYSPEKSDIELNLRTYYYN